MNKKGSHEIDIVIFTVVVMVLIFAAMFSFVSKAGKFEEKTFKLEGLNHLENNETFFSIALDFSARSAIAEAYQKMIDENTNVGLGNVNLDEVIKVYDSEFARKVADSFIKPNKNNFGLGEYKLEVKLEGEEIVIRAFDSKFLVEERDNDGKLIFSGKKTLELTKRYNLEEVGLGGFEGIKAAAGAGRCSGSVSCIEQQIEMKNFNVELEGNRIKVTSWKKFYIDGEFKNIEFKF